MRRETWEGTTIGSSHPRPLQDEATRAWNLHTALYYKAGGTPWRMSRHSTDLPTCYVSVSFYRTPDGEELHTAVARSSTSAATAFSSAAAPRRSPRPTAGPPHRDRRAETAQRRARRIPPHPRPPARPHRAAQDLAFSAQEEIRLGDREVMHSGRQPPRGDSSGITQSSEAALPRCLAHGPEAGRSGREAGKGCHCRRGSRVRGPGIRARHPVGHAARELRSGGSRRGPREGG